MRGVEKEGKENESEMMINGRADEWSPATGIEME